MLIVPRQLDCQCNSLQVHSHVAHVQSRSAAQRLKQANQCTSGLHHGFELVAEVLPTLAKLPAPASTHPPTPNLEREFAR